MAKFSRDLRNRGKGMSHLSLPSSVSGHCGILHWRTLRLGVGKSTCVSGLKCGMVWRNNNGREDSTTEAEAQPRAPSSLSCTGAVKSQNFNTQLRIVAGPLTVRCSRRVSKCTPKASDSSQPCLTQNPMLTAKPTGHDHPVHRLRRAQSAYHA